MLDSPKCGLGRFLATVRVSSVCSAVPRLAANLQGVYSSQLLTRRLPAFPALVLSVSADRAPETIAQIVFGSELMYGGRVIVQLGWRHSSLSMEQLEQMSILSDEPTSVKLTSFFGMF